MLSSVTSLSLGDLIHQYRTKSNVTLSELARITEVSKGTLSKLENGEVQKPEYYKLQAVTEALGIPFEEYIELYIKVEKSPSSVLRIFSEAIARNCPTKTVVRIAERYLTIAKGESYDVIAKFFDIAIQKSETELKLELLQMLIDYSRSHGIMPYIAKGLFQKYLIDRNDFTKLSETYQSGRYLLNYAGFLNERERLLLYYCLAVHAFSLQNHKESIELSEYVIENDLTDSEFRANAIFNACNSYFYLNDMDKGIYYFQEYKKFSFPFVQDNIRYMNGRISARYGDVNLGIAQLEEYLRGASEYNLVYTIVLLMELYLDKGKLDEVKKLFIYENMMIKSLSDAQTTPEKRGKLACFYKLKGDWLREKDEISEAFEYYRKSALEYAQISYYEEAFNSLSLITNSTLISFNGLNRKAIEELNLVFNTLSS
ncbi:helix-turn-helix domain-containing protein [Paenibacillus sp. SC116]|uniref:helix-turn-helix domain-containing protein n=1 Tax=Paenibacillus sp. SC116 TaxID=2968986 RepID=UPI00215A5588|nr:helix-turn-helix transcriptional regulator [Paenibacillus sp. SC116]MCR8845050.1 helix-turn-helix domain-containing protein [Paenibacillus sp. SC116]